MTRRVGETATRGEEKLVIAIPPIPPSDGTPPQAVEAGEACLPARQGQAGKLETWFFAAG
ncbi:MAG: hypothetical protein PHN49_04575 [Candidatus Omnitrophica bacterium]|nr:hypothetical protein [Smithellaceae bacterium]MDD5670896.1 hypothetical protein [Candidatus Omnitrophota bacterium]